MKVNVYTAADAFYDLFTGSGEHALSRNLVPEENEGLILRHLAFAEQIFPKSGIMLCPVSHARTRYFSKNCEEIVGIPPKDMMAMSIPQFFEHVHPDDLHPFQQCMGFIRTLAPYNPVDYRFVMQYRFRASGGEYMHVRDEKIAIRITDASYLSLILFSNVSDEEKFFQVRLEVFKKIKGNFLKAYTYNPKQQESEITPRQNDIAQLIIKGFTNREIAEQLGVSIYTVKNHKQMLFRKINVKSSLELASYVRENEG